MSDSRRDLGNLYRPSRESLLDRQIRDAQEAGAFDDLPYQGERLPLEDDSAAGDWALAYRMLRSAKFAPAVDRDRQGESAACLRSVLPCSRARAALERHRARARPVRACSSEHATADLSYPEDGPA